MKNTNQKKKYKREDERNARGSEPMRESVIEHAFVRAVLDAGGMAYKLNSQTANGLPDRMVLFFPGKCVFVELKAPKKMLRPLQKKRRLELESLGFPVLCINSLTQIRPVIRAILSWTPGQRFPEGIGASIPELKRYYVPKLSDMSSADITRITTLDPKDFEKTDFGETNLENQEEADPENQEKTDPRGVEQTDLEEIDPWNDEMNSNDGERVDPIDLEKGGDAE